MKRKKRGNDTIAIKGFFRLQIRDKKTGRIVGDTGYIPNQITNYGMANCFVGGPAGAANTVQIVGAMLGSGTAPASNATQLNLLNTDYYSTVGEAINGSTQAAFTQTFDGTLGAATFKNVGLLAASDGSLICGQTFASSALATTQDIALTYNINYGTA
jgi:hypothetical protein